MELRFRTFNLIFSVLIATIMSFFLSFFMIIFNIGFSNLFLPIWLRSFALSMLISLPISLFVIPIIRGILMSIITINYENEKNNSIFHKISYIKHFNYIESRLSPEILELMQEFLKSNCKEGKILFIGCGTGLLPIKISRNINYRVYGIDSSKKMVDICKNNALKTDADVIFKTNSLIDLHFDNNSFDIVFSNGFLHFWSHPIQVLNEIHRVLKPGGKVFINDLHKKANKEKIHKIIGSKIEPPEIRHTFLKNATTGTLSKEEILEILEKSKFEKSNVSLREIYMEIKLEK